MTTRHIKAEDAVVIAGTRPSESKVKNILSHRRVCEGVQRSEEAAEEVRLSTAAKECHQIYRRDFSGDGWKRDDKRR